MFPRKSDLWAQAEYLADTGIKHLIVLSSPVSVNWHMANMPYPKKHEKGTLVHTWTQSHL